MDRKLSWLALALLVIAVISVWGAWIPAKAVALRVNAFDFAEWSGVLAQVRSGEMRWFPEMVRIAIVLCGIALAVKAGDISSRWVRWLIRAAALLPALIVVPQFPFWLQDGYRIRFGIAVIGLIGVALSVLADGRERIKGWLITGTALGAVVMAMWGYAALSVPFAARYGGSMGLGWGLIVFVVMLIGAAAIEVSLMLRRSQRLELKQAS